MVFVAGQKLRASQLNALLAVGAEYNASATQTVATGTQPVIAFGTTNKSSTLVSRATQGAGHRFTLLQAGFWSINSCIRWTTADTGERYTLINSSDGGLCSEGAMVSTGGPVTIAPSVIHYFTANSWVQMEAYHNAGSNRTLEFNNGSGWGRIYLTYLGP